MTLNVFAKLHLNVLGILQGSVCISLFLKTRNQRFVLLFSCKVYIQLFSIFLQCNMSIVLFFRQLKYISFQFSSKARVNFIPFLSESKVNIFFNHLPNLELIFCLCHFYSTLLLLLATGLCRSLLYSVCLVLLLATGLCHSLLY